MAQKYLMALDYVDLHANTVLKKHAKKRPLGDIETRHRYTPTQPVLSCRTVDIDVSGTRTYRPKSSADIITEQHALIHKIYSKSRNVASAPPRRSKTPRSNTATPENNNNRNNQNKENNLKSVEVQGRPLTSLSQRTSRHTGSRSSVFSNKRPKTTGNLKAPKVIHDNFMIVHADRELIETRRSYRSLTDKIHKHWDPENHDLNTGTYQRGKKPPGVPSVDSWLTFSGSQAEESQGIVDAFADHVLEEFLEDSDSDASTLEDDEDVGNRGDYYNVEGGVGSRIAQQLQKGDKIRIGINGNVQTQDLKVKKWIKEDSYVKEEVGKENMSGNENQVIPLSWDDQVASSTARVMTPRESKNEKTTINLCETTPVVFTKLLPDQLSSAGTGSQFGKKEGFRVKQRKKNKSGMDGKEQENKVTVVTIDSRTHDDEIKIQSLTVEEVIKQNSSGKDVEKHNGHHDEMEKLSVSFSFTDKDPHDMQEMMLSQSKVSVAESYSSGGSEQKHLKVKPSQPTFSMKGKEVDLDIIGTLSVSNGQRPLSNESDQPTSIYSNKNPFPMSRSGQGRAGSARSSRSGLISAKSQKSLVSNSLVSVGGQSYRQNQNEAEYIQIAHPVKNPNSGMGKRQTDFSAPGMLHDTPRSRGSQSGVREPLPSPDLESLDAVEQANNPVYEPPPEIQIKPVVKVATPALSISIPTADYTDSALNSPTQRHAAGPHSSPQVRRANDMRDEQIDQITTLLVDAIIGPNEHSGAKS